jgi:hypothetical protein
MRLLVLLMLLHSAVAVLVLLVTRWWLYGCWYCW